MELRVRSIEIVLPDTPSQGGCLRRPRMGEYNRGLQSSRPGRPRAEGNYLSIHFRGDIGGPAVAHFVPEVPDRVVVGNGLSVR